MSNDPSVAKPIVLRAGHSGFVFEIEIIPEVAAVSDHGTDTNYVLAAYQYSGIFGIVYIARRDQADRPHRRDWRPDLSVNQACAPDACAQAKKQGTKKFGTSFHMYMVQEWRANVN
jgi:hypothetical protein